MGLFNRTKYLTVVNRQEDESLGNENEVQPNIPDGMWVKCTHCGKPVYNKELENNYKICSNCGGYFRLLATERIDLVVDRGSFEEFNGNYRAKNPLNYPGYKEKIKQTQDKTGILDGVITGKATIGKRPCVLAVMDSNFMMGSMGSVVGEKITLAIEAATKLELPFIAFTCSGGARMQEGIVSLMQMAKTSAALARHGDAGFLYVTVLTDPTTGGVTASFAMLGDIILAEPRTLIGFAGRRVIEQTINQKLPDDFQKAEFLLEHGFIDSIVEREKMKATLVKILKLHGIEEVV